MPNPMDLSTVGAARLREHAALYEQEAATLRGTGRYMMIQEALLEGAAALRAVADAEVRLYGRPGDRPCCLYYDENGNRVVLEIAQHFTLLAALAALAHQEESSNA